MRPPSTSRSRHVIEYRILDTKRGLPQRRVAVHATAGEIKHLAEDGFLVLSGLLSKGQVSQFRRALAEVLQREAKGQPTTDGCFGSPYLRHLIDKHALFLKLFKLRSTLSIARAVLGPQVKFEEITARVTNIGVQSPVTPWHIHLRVVPEPLPPFFAYPHGVDCLLYLDDINDDSGAICLLPGSHRRPNETHPANDFDDKPGQQQISLSAGDCLLVHPNLWHRVLPPRKTSGIRRVIIFGYFPSWMSGEERGSPKPQVDTLAQFRKHSNSSIRELAGEFFWG
jgi:phytanoyl-CoA dioxygenase PhyH